MKAITYYEYGAPEVLQLREVATPTPKDDEVLIRIRATAVNSGDARIRGLNVPAGFGLLTRLMFGFFRPRKPILGNVLAGTVEAVGGAVTNFQVGDAVFAMDSGAMGAYAEYKVMPAGGAIARKPEQLSFEEAASLPFGGTTALTFLRDMGKLQAGEKVLINGASGAVGTAAVQLAKHFGAEVTAVSSAANHELVRSLGADRVIDYKSEDFTQNGVSYDIIMDTVGNVPWSRAHGSLNTGGRLLVVAGSLSDMLRMPWVALTSDKKLLAGVATESAADLQLLAELTENGAYRPVVDRRYPLEQMAEAHRYVDGGHKRGNVVIAVE